MNDFTLFLELPIAVQLAAICFVACTTGLLALLLAVPPGTASSSVGGRKYDSLPCSPRQRCSLSGRLLFTGYFSNRAVYNRMIWISSTKISGYLRSRPEFCEHRI
jgi:hypothetical protein